MAGISGGRIGMLAVVLRIETLEYVFSDVCSLGGIHDVTILGSSENEGIAVVLAVLLQVGVYIIEHGFG